MARLNKIRNRGVIPERRHDAFLLAFLLAVSMNIAFFAVQAILPHLAYLLQALGPEARLEQPTPEEEELPFILVDPSLLDDEIPPEDPETMSSVTMTAKQNSESPDIPEDSAYIPEGVDEILTPEPGNPGDDLGAITTPGDESDAISDDTETVEAESAEPSEPGLPDDPSDTEDTPDDQPEPLEMVDLPDPVEPADPTEPTEPVEPTDPVEPPPEPVEQFEPIEPVEQVEMPSPPPDLPELPDLPPLPELLEPVEPPPEPIPIPEDIPDPEPEPVDDPIPPEPEPLPEPPPDPQPDQALSELIDLAALPVSPDGLFAPDLPPWREPVERPVPPAPQPVPLPPPQAYQTPTPEDYPVQPMPPPQAPQPVQEQQPVEPQPRRRRSGRQPEIRQIGGGRSAGGAPRRRNVETRAADLFADPYMAALRHKYGEYMEKMARQLQQSLNRTMLLYPTYYSTGVARLAFRLGQNGEIVFYETLSTQSHDGSDMTLQMITEQTLAGAGPFDPPSAEMFADPLFQRMSLQVTLY